MAYLLLVDDDEDFVSAAATVLRAAGHDVEVALEIQRAAECLAQRTPDLVILDVMFPEDPRAGFEFARTVVRKGGASHIPILMLTAVNEEAPIKFSADDIDEDWLPVKDFLEKPIDLDVLRNRVAALLER